MEYLLKLLNGSWIDDVTRLPNGEFAKEILNVIKDSREEFFIIKIVLNFPAEKVNESNFVIARAASVIKHSVRLPKDFVCRVSENEFWILLHGVNKNVAEQIATRIKESLDYLLVSFGNKQIKINTDIKIEKLGGAPDESQ
ncbi:diguanylate cyclase [Thermosipho ferrireducens]|uniref:Diguanylate cyclase n=1 Tax=Thermosipho ferrireducens TaxID=2571116 RepID=A0ABX7S7W5_9BACT|nr:diguanylate cyclase [Thermosipho ferrireducens]QTA38003.1 diguanylate cyclase [Thermosipho ferrireducens]